MPPEQRERSIIPDPCCCVYVELGATQGRHYILTGFECADLALAIGGPTFCQIFECQTIHFDGPIYDMYDF